MTHATMFATAAMEPTAVIADRTELSFWDATFWDAILQRDRRMDGVFFYGVFSTGIYCRPSCRSRRPNRENVLFFKERARAERAGFRACRRCHPEQAAAVDPRVEIVEKVCRYLEEHLDEMVSLRTLGVELGLSPFHIHRTFREVLGITPRAYTEVRRTEALRTRLRTENSVTEAVYSAGYGSSSRVYERSNPQLGMTPATYRKGGASVGIQYAIADCTLGKLLVAWTARGVCAIQFGDSADEAIASLLAEFPQAVIAASQDSGFLDDVLRSMSGRPSPEALPLDIRATAFQRRVWEYLQTIPRGATRSYTEVAQAIEQPTAIRAVARACATNPVAVAIPCHRVVGKNGDLSGYRWGLGRKKALLLAEQGPATEGLLPFDAHGVEGTPNEHGRDQEE